LGVGSVQVPPSELFPPADLPIATHPAVIDAAGRAIVYCYVEWSMPEVYGRPVVRQMVAQLRAARDPIPFDFFAVEEDAPAFADWLVARGQRQHRSAIGSGIVLWLEAGQCVATEVCAWQAGVARLVARTESLWGNTAA
jgi:hypothetical protein